MWVLLRNVGSKKVRTLFYLLISYANELLKVFRFCLCYKILSQRLKSSCVGNRWTIKHHGPGRRNQPLSKVMAYPPMKR